MEQQEHTNQQETSCSSQMLPALSVHQSIIVHSSYLMSILSFSPVNVHVGRPWRDLVGKPKSSRPGLASATGWGQLFHNYLPEFLCFLRFYIFIRLKSSKKFLYFVVWITSMRKKYPQPHYVPHSAETLKSAAVWCLRNFRTSWCLHHTHWAEEPRWN